MLTLVTFYTLKDFAYGWFCADARLWRYLAGVFKNWPSSNASLVDVSKVEELRVLKQTEVSLPGRSNGC